MSINNNDLKKATKVISFILLCLVVLFLFCCVFITVFVSKNINYQEDEMLFSDAEEENVIRLYTGDEETPTVYEEICFNDCRKTWVDLCDISENVKYAFLAAEDRDYYRHKGVNVKRTLYAAVNLLTKKKSLFGASTITQQVIKNISGDDEVTLKRKLAEILRSYHMEKSHTKDEILGVYLNIVPLSENVIGVGTGALTYFDKEAKDLSLTEAATLAGITNAPTKYNPYLHPDECLAKRNRVLYAMKEAGYISDEEYGTYSQLPLGVAERKTESITSYSWFTETVLSDVLEAFKNYGYSENVARQLLNKGGLNIYTTVDTRIQNILEETFENEKNLPAEISDGLSYAMCIVDPNTGKLRGIIGNGNKKSANRITNYALTCHTPGSSLKPLALYAPLIDEGKINAATVFDDVPLSFSEQNGFVSSYPQNSPKVYAGLTTVKDALRLSKNTVAMRLYEMRGAEEIYADLVNDFGFDTVIRKRVSKDASTLTDLAPSPLALGQLTYGVSLRKLTEAYAVFPADGVYRKGRSFTKITDGTGNTVLVNEASEKKVYKTSTARIMNQLLSGVVKDGTAMTITLKNKLATAGKTGTSGDDKDRLFIGYTPYYTAGIWCGYENGEKSVSAVCPSHLDIWNSVMTKVHEEIKEESAPKSFSTEGLVRLAYCKDSGEKFCPTCAKDPRNDRMDYGYFSEDNLPTEICKTHICVWYDASTNAIAGEYCPFASLTETALIRVENRSFPKDIVVTDAQYVYRETDPSMPYGDSFDIPYFYYQIKDGVCVGRSKGKKQYNSYCYLHEEEDEKSA